MKKFDESHKDRPEHHKADFKDIEVDSSVAEHEEEHGKHEEHKHKRHERVHIQVSDSKQTLLGNTWFYASIVLAIVAIILFAILATRGNIGTLKNPGAVNTNTAVKDEFIFLYSDACTTACAQLEPAAKEIAQTAGMVFRKIKYPQPIEVPGYFVLKDSGSTAPALLQSKSALIVEMCTITNNAELCKDAETAKKTIQDEALQAEQEKLKSIKKADKPIVEMFVMSHCPYGTQIEKGALPVAKLLGDKIDFQIKFVNYAMHGKTELDEQMNQYCIQTEQKEKFIPYLECFLKEGKTAECLTETGIDKTKLDSCIKATDAKYKITELFNDKTTWSGGRFPQFPIHDAECKEYGVQGSPTLVLNGAQQESGRDSASLLAAVCAGFNTPPSECSTKLSSASPSPGFGFGATGSDTAAQCG